MVRLRSEIHGALEYVENAAIHVVAHLPAQFRIKRLRIPASQFRDVSNSETVEIGGYGWADSGDALDRALDRPGGPSYYLSDHMASSFPSGPVK